MRALLCLVLSLFAIQGGADEQYQYVVGLAEKGLHDRVVKEAQSFLRDHASHAKADSARYRLACALFELDNEREAMPHFAALAKKKGFEFEAEVQFRLGQCALALDDLAAAETALTRASSANKDYLKVPATALLADTLMRRKDYARAEERYAAVLDAAPKGEFALDARCGIAWCAYRKGELDRASEMIRRLLAEKPKARAQEMQFLLGECELDRKRPKEAADAYRSVKEGPFADAALRGLGFALAAAGDHRGAAQAFHAFGERFPESRFKAECALHEAIELLAAKDAPAALAVLESGRAGADAPAMYWTARAQSETGAKDAALRTCDRALKLAPEKDLAERLYLLRGDALTALGRSREAQDAYRRSESDYALQAAAIASLKDGRPGDAARAAASLLEKYPESQYRIDALMTLGEALFNQKSYADAEQAFDAARSEDQDAARALRASSRLAWCRYLSGDMRTAAQRFQVVARAKGAAPEIEEAAFMTARALQASGDEAGARAAYDAYLSRHAEGEHADEALLALSRLEGGPAGDRRLEALLAKDPTAKAAVEARYELAERSSKAGKLDQAKSHYRGILEQAPQSELAPAARYGLAFALYQEGAYAPAQETLAPLAENPPADTRLRDACLELGLWTACKLAEPAEILGNWRSFSAICRDDERLLQAARTALAALPGAKERAEVLRVLEERAKKSSSPKLAAAVAIERAFLAVEAEDVERAERELARIPPGSADPTALSEAQFSVGEAYFAAGNVEKALALYDAALANPAWAAADTALYKSGFARLQTNDLRGAERAFRTLIEQHAKSPLFHETLFLLGEAQFRAERYDAAIESLERVRKEAPQHAVMPKVLFRLGLCNAKLERWQLAADTLARLVRTYPQFENLAEAELVRGRALAALSDSRGARGAFARVIELDRGALSAQAHLALGRLHLASQDQDAALSEFLKVAVLYATPDEVSEALFLAGETLEARGDRARAESQYRELIEKHRDSRFARAAEKRLAELARR